jgi:hypothetical protein
MNESRFIGFPFYPPPEGAAKPSDRLTTGRLASIAEAERHRLFLKRLSLHGGGHHCALSIEELPDGAFAIVCLSHQDPDTDT